MSFCSIVSLSVYTQESRTPLYWASFYGHRAVVELLLENGADISICNEVISDPDS